MHCRVVQTGRYGQRTMNTIICFQCMHGGHIYNTFFNLSITFINLLQYIQHVMCIVISQNIIEYI